MTDTEERIAKLQKLLDRVLSRGDETPPPPDALGAPESAPVDTKKEERSEEEPARPPSEKEPSALEATVVAARQDELASPAEARAEAPAEARAEAPAEAPVDAPAEAPAALESRSRLVAVAPESAEELSEDDLIPESRVPGSEREDAVPLVRRSRVPAEPRVAGRRVRDEDEELSDGRIVLGLEDVQIAEESLLSEEERLAAEIAAEEVQSGEIEEDSPSSSRRPIAMETVARDEPPESGKQVAALPVTDQDVTVVRRSSVPPSPHAPEIVRPELASTSAVAQFTGAATEARPASFGELLDDALSL